MTVPLYVASCTEAAFACRMSNNRAYDWCAAVNTPAACCCYLLVVLQQLATPYELLLA